MGDVISLRSAHPIDPILRKGDLVRLVAMAKWAGLCEDDPEEDWEAVERIDGMCAVVLQVEMLYGEDTESPGQAASITVAVPFDDGWEEVPEVPLHHVHRVLGPEADEIRGYGD